MKKRCFTLMLCLLAATFAAEANPVDMRTARQVAVKFMNANAKVPLRGPDELQLVTTYNISRGAAAFYVFNTSNGFVIVSADDCATPILSYSNEGRFDRENIPIQFQEYLQGFVEQIEYGIENHLKADAKKAQQWELVRTTGRLTNNRTDEAVGPLITTMWDQHYPYNMFAPSGCLTGCTATAMAQEMNYWEWPVQGIGEHSYVWNGDTLSANFGETTYDWANMLDSYGSQATQEQREAVATLMYHCGVAVNMHYGTNISTASLYPGTLINYFNYSNEMSLEFLENYSSETWEAKLKDCLNRGMPLHYVGYASSGGHAFVCDGYDSNNMFHFNMGWGSLGGYCAIEALYYNRMNSAIFNMHPPYDEPTVYEINVSIKNNEGGTVSGGGTYVHGDTVTLSATADEGQCFQYWEENGGIASRDANYSFTANFNRNLVAVFTGPVTISITAMEGGTASGSGIYCYEECEVIATPDEGYDFAYWTEDDEIVSIEADYIFLILGERHLTAHFIESGIIDFADNNVKTICLSHWDNNGDGELSLAEAARVTSLGQVFRNNSNITSFNELQYFINLTTIGDNAFYQCRNLTSVTLPNTTTSVTGSAFYNCSRLTSVTLPDSLVFIGGGAFSGCSSLATLTLPNTLTTIGGSAFYNCTNLTSLPLPNTLTSIGGYAFRNCTKLTTLDIPNSVTSIGGYAFYGCTSLTSLTIPESVTSIEEHIFYGCTALTSLNLPNTITSIGAFALYNCTGLAGPLILPDSLVSIGRYAFYGCKGITSLTLPNAVTSIGDNAFVGCSNLTGSLIIPNSITSIERYVFYGCSSLTSLTLSDSLTSISEYVFYNCRNLSSITALAVTPPTLGSSVFYGVSPDIPVYVPCESVEAYQSANGWSAFSNIVGLCEPGTITLVADLPEGGEVTGSGSYESGTLCTVTAAPNGGYCFINWTEDGRVVSADANYSFIVTGDRLLTAHFVSDGNIVFADDNAKAICVANWDTNGDGELSYYEASRVMTIGEVFKGHTEITSFEELQYFVNLTLIGDNAFKGCSGLTGSLFLPNTVTYIGAYAFQGCSGLTGPLSLPEAITSIGTYAFSGCSGFTGSLTIPNTITSIANSTFSSCRGFTGDLILPNAVTSIGDYAFYFCSGFTGDLIIPNSVTSIGNSAFRYCYGFRGNLTLGNSVTTIGNDAFYNCFRLKGNLNIPNSVTTIGNDAFCYCSGFTGSLTIPNSVRTIGEFAFCYLDGLSGSVTIGSYVTSIGRYAFSDNSGLKSVIVLRQQPPTALANSFDHDIPLYVPCESVESYQSATGWDAFTTIIGMCSAGTISVVADPVEGGEVSGAGTYDAGTSCTVIATPNEGYRFAFWTENGNVVSYDSNYSFIVTGESVMTARFVPDGNIVFADANVKTLCVENWDNNGDGELSYYEAALVMSLEDVFTGNTEIISFDELQYFISLSLIDSNAFNDCYNLKTIVFPSTITSIEGGAFCYCSSLTGRLTIPNSVTMIGPSAFYGCSGLTGDLTIPDAVTSIGDHAFGECHGLTGSLLVGNSVASIGSYAFYGCNGLTTLTIGNSLSTIANYAFNYCYGLNSIYILSEMPPTVGSFAFYEVSANIPVYVPCESVEAYQSAAGWNAFPNITGMCSSGTVSVAADPEEGGTVSGAGTYEGGTFCTVTATPNEGYYFANWTKNGSVVSNDSNYSFVVMGESAMIAHFVTEGNIVFADDTVKALCVQNWDTNEDGELSYLEAALVSSLEDVFNYNEEITSFDELQYFIGLSSIDDYAFDYCYNLSSMTLPESLTSIGDGAFEGCSGLTGSLTLPNSLTSIGSYAFSNCYGLTGSLTIPNSVTSIGEWAFSDCSGFTGLLTLPNSLTTIEAFAFYDCYGLTGSLTIPDAVTSIGYGAFEYCSNLTGSLSIGNSVTSIDNYAFYDCYNLTGSLTIGSAVTSIGYCAFCYCQGLNSMIVLSETPPTLNSSAFYQVPTNIPVYVPCESVEAYQSAAGWNAFPNITGMCSPGTVSVAADPVEGGTVSGAGTYEGGTFCTVTATPNEGYCFANWTKNGSVVSNDPNYSFVVTGESVMTAHFVTEGNIVFADDTVKTLCVQNWDTNGDGELSYLEASWIASLGDVFSYNEEITSFEELQYFIGLISISEYAFSGCSSLTGSLFIPESVTSIGYGAFYGCSGLTGDLTIPDAVTWIGYGAFEGCSGFTGTLTLGNSLTFIDDYVFYDCQGLTGSMTLPNTVTRIGDDAFSGCDGLNAVYYTGDIEQWCNISFSSNPLQYAHNLYINNELVTDLVIPETVTEIKPYVFAGATCLTSLTIHNAVTSIGKYAFSNCRGLTGSLTIPNAVTSIGNYAFYYCDGLTGELILPSSLTTIGNSAFHNCTGLTGALTIPNSVTTIGEWAFFYCTGFSDSLTISNSVTSIGNCAFYHCSGLTGTLTIPNSVTTIGHGAFEYCTGFTGSPTIPNSVTTIGTYAFYYCNGLTGSLTIPNSVTTIGSYAFYGCNGFTGNLTIGSSVTNIGSYAFGYCRNFTSMNVLPETPPTAANAFNNYFYDIPVQIPCGSVAAYQQASGWSNFTNYQENCQTQTVVLAAGYNWVSFHVETGDPIEILDMLKAGLGDNGLSIEANGMGTIYDGAEWFGDLDYEGIYNEQMYLIEVSVDCTVELQGTPADPANYEITIYPGWNWIGFPCSEEVEVNVALGGFEAEEGDMVESKGDITMFLDGLWSEFTLVPGQGYLYYSNSTTPKTLVFQTGRSKD